MRLLQAQKLVQYLRECEDALDWITDKVSRMLPKKLNGSSATGENKCLIYLCVQALSLFLYLFGRSKEMLFLFLLFRCFNKKELSSF